MHRPLIISEAYYAGMNRYASKRVVVDGANMSWEGLKGVYLALVREQVGGARSLALVYKCGVNRTDEMCLRLF